MLLGERLRAIREMKQLSQGHIEKRTGLLRAYVSRVENGHTMPTIETLQKWTQALGVSMAELFSENGKAPEPLDLPVVKTPRLDKAGQNALRRLTQSLAKMSPKDRILVVELANKLAARSSRRP
jgi:transcriptional regulator with XRE-family HTH domain